jgi:hypothetical protein
MPEDDETLALVVGASPLRQSWRYGALLRVALMVRRQRS